MNRYLIFKTLLWAKYHYIVHVTFEETENKEYISFLFIHNKSPQIYWLKPPHISYLPVFVGQKFGHKGLSASCFRSSLGCNSGISGAAVILELKSGKTGFQVISGIHFFVAAAWKFLEGDSSQIPEAICNDKCDSINCTVNISIIKHI